MAVLVVGGSGFGCRLCCSVLMSDYRDGGGGFGGF